MKKLILLLFLSAGTVFSQTASSPQLAYCSADKGCTFCRSEYSYKDLDLALNYLGTFERDRGILTFFTNKNGEDTHYPDRKRTPAELHTYFGGKGSPSVLNACPMPFGFIQPNDGDWSIRTSTPKAKNCPPGMGERLKEVQMFKNGPKTFSKPFTPNDLLAANEVKWFTTGSNRYRAVFSGAIDGFGTIYDVKVLSPDSMQGNLSLGIKIPGKPVCEVTMDFTYTRSIN